MIALLIISAALAQSFIDSDSEEFTSSFVVIDDELDELLPDDLLVSPWVELEDGEVRASPGGVFEWMTSGWATYGYEQSLSFWMVGGYGLAWAEGVTEPVQELVLKTEEVICWDGDFSPIEVYPEPEQVFSVIWSSGEDWESAPQATLIRYLSRGSGLIDCTGSPWSYGTEIRVRVTWLEES